MIEVSEVMLQVSYNLGIVNIFHTGLLLQTPNLLEIALGAFQGAPDWELLYL